MPVNSTHPDYDVRLCEWETVLDCMAGKSAIMAGGEKYLPKLHDQSEDDYEAYQKRASWFGATKRTAAAMVGFLFRKAPTVETSIPEPYQWNIDLANTKLTDYARKVAVALTSTGRAGTLIDWSEEKKRPYFAFYRERDVINWRTEARDGKNVLVLLVLREWIQREGTDEFEPETVEQFRVLRLREGVVEVTTYERASDGDEFMVSNAYTPSRRGENLTEIPFVFHNADSQDACPGQVPLLDIAEINTAHFRNSADLENGRHVCGIPTPVAIGFGEAKLYLGCNYAWTSDNPDAHASFLEFTGAGLSALEKGLEEKVTQMAALGARMIEPRATDPEAYATVALRNTAETSTLSDIATQLGNSLTNALAWFEWWDGTGATLEDQKAEFQVHRDFGAVALTSEEMTALVALWQQKAISYDTLFEKLQRGEVVPEARTLEEEQELIEENPPMPAPKSLPVDPTTGKPIPPVPPGQQQQPPADDAAADE